MKQFRKSSIPAASISSVCAVLLRWQDFAVLLTHIFDNVHLINTTSTSEMFEQLFRISSDDVLIPISFPRYSQRTLKAAKYARNKGADVIAITDCAASPLASVAISVCLPQ